MITSEYKQKEKESDSLTNLFFFFRDMCLNREIEYFSSNESINEIDLNWPFEETLLNRLILACDICFYPISLEENIVDELRSEENITFGLVIPIIKLFSKVKINNENLLDQWKTRVYQPL